VYAIVHCLLPKDAPMPQPLERTRTQRAEQPRIKQQQLIGQAVRSFLGDLEVSSPSACLKCGSASDLREITAFLVLPGGDAAWKISLPLCERCASPPSPIETASLAREMDAIHSDNGVYWKYGAAATREARANYQGRQARLEEIRAALYPPFFISQC
jgi:hypothetical protein